MDRDVFIQHFRTATTKAVGFAREYVIEPLSDSLVFRVRLGASNDKHMRLDPALFKTYPEDNARSFDLLNSTEAQAVAALWRDGLVPQWINISVVAQSGSNTVVELRCCGRFAVFDQWLYHQREGHPPFHVLGPRLPANYIAGDRFSIWHRLEAWNPEQLIEAKPFLPEVWSLTAYGEPFDDNVLNGLPVFPAMEILNLEHSHIRGRGIASLSNQPKLRVLRLKLASPDHFSLSNTSPFATLESLSIQNLPPRPCGIEEFLQCLPKLDSLVIEGNSVVFLEAAGLRDLRHLTICGKQIDEAAKLPSEIGHLALHLSETTSDDVRRVLSTVKHVKTLALGGTPIDDAFAEEIADRYEPEYFNLFGAGVTKDCLHRISQAHPSIHLTPTPDGKIRYG